MGRLGDYVNCPRYYREGGERESIFKAFREEHTT